MFFESKQINDKCRRQKIIENLVVCGLVMIDDSRWLPWGRDKNFLKWIL